MSIEVINDGKEKFQSFEAKVSLHETGSMGYYTAYLSGYGANEREAKINLFSQMERLKEELEG